MPPDTAIQKMKIKKQKITTDDILDHWRLGKSSIDWRPLTVKEKSEWLKACLSYTGLPKQITPGFHYSMEGNQVTCELDFYCLLGEVFFGYRGYFGQDLDGLDDCFIEIKNHQSTDILESEKITLTIKNSVDLATVLNQEFDTYFIDAIYILKKHGLIVTLE